MWRLISMADQPEKVERTRLSVTFTKIHMDGLEYLVREGIYLDKGAVIRDAVRRLFGVHGLEGFRGCLGLPGEAGEEDDRHE